MLNQLYIMLAVTKCVYEQINDDAKRSDVIIIILVYFWVNCVTATTV